ncbi:MAG: hypothetical protein LBQ57_02325, partial [Spirochaetales bacterium]|nr:hypothetical protein [Spirochaetales bacterium]
TFVAIVTRYNQVFIKMIGQSEYLRSGYAAVDSRYDEGLGTTAGTLATKENTMKTAIGNNESNNPTTYINAVTNANGYADQIWDTIFGAGQHPTGFDNKFAVYQAGKQLLQAKVGTAKGNAQSALAAALTTAGISYQQGDLTNTQWVQTLLGDKNSGLAKFLLDEINGAMGVGSSTELTNSTNVAAIRQLNEDLLRQIGEDIPELRALVSDFMARGYTNTSCGDTNGYIQTYHSSGNPYLPTSPAAVTQAQGSGKASHLLPDFLCDMLKGPKGKGKDDDIAMV